MKTLNNHVLFYDESCPLCRVYSKSFIDFNMLDANGRQSFNELAIDKPKQLDLEKAKDKIALLNKETGEVIYGLDSLLKILSPNFKFISFLILIPGMEWILGKLYLFISYNRKVIIPSNERNEAFSCVPKFNLKYRIVFIVFTSIISGIILNKYVDLLTAYIAPSHLYREQLIAFGQLLFLATFTLNLSRNNFWDYLGNVSVISFAGSLLLLPVIIIHSFVALNLLIALGSFTIVFILMFLEHYRRIKMLGLSAMLCLCWLIYRTLLLIIIL